MAVGFDANATADATANGVTSITSSNLTIGSGSNRALGVQLAFENKAVTSVTVTWDNGASNQALTQIVTASSAGVSGVAQLWGLVNPISGAKSLRAAWTGSADVCINGVSWTGVDQAGGATSFPHSTSATGNSTAPSVVVTSAVGNAAMATLAHNQVITSTSTQTQTFLDNAPAGISAAGSRGTGAATVTHTWLTVSAQWVVAGCDILADAGGATTQTFESHRPAPWAPSSPTLRGF